MSDVKEASVTLRMTMLLVPDRLFKVFKISCNFHTKQSLEVMQDDVKKYIQ